MAKKTKTTKGKRGATPRRRSAPRRDGTAAGAHQQDGGARVGAGLDGGRGVTRTARRRQSVDRLGYTWRHGSTARSRAGSGRSAGAGGDMGAADERDMREGTNPRAESGESGARQPRPPAE